MKKKIGKQNALYPMPITLIGAMVNGKPTFLNIAHVGILNVGDPNLISVSMGKRHHTNQGIKINKTFSVNIPSEDLVIKADDVGLVSGRDTDKSGVFEVAFGELETAPMIKSCPISMECRLHDTIDLASHDVFIGAIVATYVDDSVLTGEVIDLARVRPLLFDMSGRKYWSVGKPVGDCWSIGKQYK
jgi:flavin reductase (DIM6/NTAB) family NADH-FMN oxidoreductase RutF